MKIYLCLIQNCLFWAIVTIDIMKFTIESKLLNLPLECLQQQLQQQQFRQG